MQPEPAPASRQIAIRADGAIQFFALSEIAMLQAEGNYTRAFLVSGRALLIGRRLGQLEVELGGSTLVRISCFIMVNHTAILAMRRTGGGKQTGSLRGLSDPVTVGRTAARGLRAWAERPGAQ